MTRRMDDSIFRKNSDKSTNIYHLQSIKLVSNWNWVCLKSHLSKKHCEWLVTWESFLRFYQQVMMAQLEGAVEYTDSISAEGSDFPQQLSWIWHEIIWWQGSGSAGTLGNAEYPFIAIAPRSTLAWSGWLGFMAYQPL